MSSVITNNTSPKEAISGRNIYIDKKGRHILYVKSTETGYYIPDKEAEAFNLYKNRYALPVAVFMLLASLFDTWQIPLLIGIAFFAVLEVRYRKWLATLTRIPNYKPDTPKSIIDGIVAGGNKNKQLLLAVLYLLLGVLIVIYGFYSNSAPITLVIDFAVLVFCIYFAAIKFIAVSRMK